MKKVFLALIVILSFVSFAQYASATNPCNTKAYKKSMQSHSYNYQTTGRTNTTTAQTKPSTAAAPKKATEKTHKQGKGLDASDYVHPEDFYEWYYDDFIDYEEAEDYYYHHGGK